jgi:hypothetical protein
MHGYWYSARTTLWLAGKKSNSMVSPTLAWTVSGRKVWSPLPTLIVHVFADGEADVVDAGLESVGVEAVAVVTCAAAGAMVNATMAVRMGQSFDFMIVISIWSE